MKKQVVLLRLIALCLVLALLPVPVYGTSELPSGDMVEPRLSMGEIVLTEAAGETAPATRSGAAGAEESYITLEEAIVYTRQQASLCQEHITFCIKTPAGPTMNDYLPGDDFWEQVFAHTGISNQGDYIYRSLLENAHIDGSGMSDGTNAYFTYEIRIQYRTTAEQEAALTKEIQKLLQSLDLEGKTDYEKIRAVYDYMTANIYYDYEGLNDPADLVKYTAYGALMEKSSVCQGYATLFYRLMLELGIDCRYISGVGDEGRHGWNIVKLEGKYYNLDATWDASRAQVGVPYEFFLQCEENFADHIRDSEFDTAGFHAAYPMADSDYEPNAQPAFVTGDVDDTGEINNFDLLLLLYYTNKRTTLEGTRLLAADIDGDGKVNVWDVSRMVLFLNKRIPSL